MLAVTKRPAAIADQSDSQIAGVTPEVVCTCGVLFDTALLPVLLVRLLRCNYASDEGPAWDNAPL